MVIGGLASSAVEFHKHEIVDPDTVAREVIAELDAYFTPSCGPDERLQFRLDEIDKIDGFKAFEAVYREQANGSRIFGHRWVDTDSKSRITCQDFKKFGKDDNAQTVS